MIEIKNLSSVEGGDFTFD